MAAARRLGQSTSSDQACLGGTRHEYCSLLGNDSSIPGDPCPRD